MLQVEKFIMNKLSIETRLSLLFFNWTQLVKFVLALI